MTMRGGLSIATAGTRPRFAYARPVNPLWLAEMRRLLIADEPGGASRVQKPDRVPTTAIADAAR